MDSLQKEINEIYKLVKVGGTICYPTDTIWGIGCDATNTEAVEKIYKIKKRDASKSMLILVDSIDAIFRYIDEVPEVAVQLLEVSDEPTTLILEGACRLAKNLIAHDGTIGIRVVNHPFLTPLLKKLNKPLVSTSANLSGQPTAKSFDEIEEEILASVDYIVEYGRDQMPATPSKIISLSKSGEIKIIR
ncbi:MAG: L-threonylcarbamoyladenylate synthase [Salinivirgaceae bacterium]|nr:L-threonylcarbamoyladenylate synthase [Salinivirgaceae bacterium]MDD4745836.1 L-threonylcarbamoyladenylate synthase [Salinivirgaceae bacterium]MDY0280238.1 L-threonylcarbamoyladenylate synthase [Salinivirgaceae bacterium]